MTFITLEEAAKISGKSTRTLRRQIDKLSDTVKNNVTKKDKNKLLISADFAKTLTNVTESVTENVTDVTVKKDDSDDLKRQIFRLEKLLEEKESELNQRIEKHLEDLRTFKFHELNADDKKQKLLTEAKTEKQDLLIQKAVLQEKLESEKAKTRTSYFVAALLFVFLIVLFLMISLQVF
jgi:polynucleotide 5'-kinase involved in rRNA processing